uniref:Uncharacterized protein n=1 Tax=Opuntia streptacantha TaxID=393608 RepID=A0A7C9DFC8_OPUST
MHEICRRLTKRQLSNPTKCYFLKPWHNAGALKLLLEVLQRLPFQQWFYGCHINHLPCFGALRVLFHVMDEKGLLLRSPMYQNASAFLTFDHRRFCHLAISMIDCRKILGIVRDFT